MSRTFTSVAALVMLTVPEYARAADFEHALVIIVDDLGTDKVGVYADDVVNEKEIRPATPTIDLLAETGVRFTDAWTTPLCSPTRATLYSGEYPYRTGVGNALSESATTRLAPRPATLMMYARDAGLSTGLFGKWHVGHTRRTLTDVGVVMGRGEYPVQLGFDVFEGSMTASVESYTNWLYTSSRPLFPGSDWYRTTYTRPGDFVTERTTDDALDWLSDVAADRHLAVVSYNMVHNTRNATGVVNWDDGATACGAALGTDIENHRVMVECLDSELANLLEGVPELESTLVIFLGDNGTDPAVAEGNFADRRGKGTVYESGVRVPFLLVDGAALRDTLDNGGVLPEAHPVYRLDPGEVVTAPSSVVDLYATIVDYLDLGSGLCVPGVSCARDSKSLRSVIETGVPSTEEIWTEVFQLGGTPGGEGALRVGDYKLVVSSVRSGACRRYEMYDLAADRWETTNVFADPAYEAERLDLLDRLAWRERFMEVPWLYTTECASGGS